MYTQTFLPVFAYNFVAKFEELSEFKLCCFHPRSMQYSNIHFPF